MQPGRLTPVNPARYRPFPAYKPTDNQWVNIGLYIRGATGMLAQYKASTETFLVNGFETPVPFYAVAEWRPSSAPPTPPVDTSYSNPLGRGDRRTLITITTSVPFLEGPGGVQTFLIDGDEETANQSIHTFIPLTSNSWMTLDLGTPHVVNEVTWLTNADGPDGTWQWLGSNDNENWTPLGSTFEMTQTAILVVNTLADNQTAFRYYRQQGVSGQTNINYWLKELLLKVSA